MSSTTASAGPLEPGGPVPAANVYWRGWPEVREDLRSSARLVAILAVAGLIGGLLWWWLAPRADFRITDAGPVVIGHPPQELLLADDVILVLILSAMGMIAGAAAWLLRRRRGVATVLALAVGASVMAVVAWQLGELLGAGPSKTELADIGNVVTTRLALGSVPGLALAPFAALLAYLVPVLTARGDDIGRTPDPNRDSTPVPDGSSDRSLVDVPPGRTAP